MCFDSVILKYFYPYYKRVKNIPFSNGIQYRFPSMLLLYNHVIAIFRRYVGHYAFLVSTISSVWNFCRCPSQPHFTSTCGQLLFILKDSEKIMNLVPCHALSINDLQILICVLQDIWVALCYLVVFCHLVVFFISQCKCWLICFQSSSSTLLYRLWGPCEQALYLFITFSLLIQCLTHSTCLINICYALDGVWLCIPSCTTSSESQYWEKPCHLIPE